MRLPSSVRPLLFIGLAVCALLAGGATKIVQDQCGPFADVDPTFCPFVTELYYLGITAGTSATTFSPNDPLTRAQGAVFVARGLNRSLERSSRRAALGQWWTSTPHYDIGLAITSVGASPNFVVSDGQDVWVSSFAGSVSRIRESDGRVLETWTVPNALGLLCAMGRIFVASNQSPGALYVIDPAQSGMAPTLVAGNLGDYPWGIVFDGSRIWTANQGASGGSVSIITPSASTPWPVTTVTNSMASPIGAVFDGSSVWMTDTATQTLNKLNSDGSVILSVPAGAGFPAFDGANIWVPRFNVVSVVNAASGALLTTVTVGGLQGAFQAAFDGERILVTNNNLDGAALFRAADLSPIGFFPTPGALGPRGVCSNGLNFWIAFNDSASLGRF